MGPERERNRRPSAGAMRRLSVVVVGCLSIDKNTSRGQPPTGRRAQRARQDLNVRPLPLFQVFLFCSCHAGSRAARPLPANKPWKGQQCVPRDLLKFSQRVPPCRQLVTPLLRPENGSRSLNCEHNRQALPAVLKIRAMSSLCAVSASHCNNPFVSHLVHAELVPAQFSCVDGWGFASGNVPCPGNFFVFMAKIQEYHHKSTVRL